MKKWMLAPLLSSIAMSGFAITLGEDSIDSKYNVSIRSSEMAEFPICMGSLIDRYWILTAGHCVVMSGEDEESEKDYHVTLPGKLAVTFGSTSLVVSDEGTPSDINNILNVSHVVVHPNYRRLHQVEVTELGEELVSTTMANDIALLRLELPLDSIDTVAIASQENMAEIEPSLIDEWRVLEAGDNRPSNIQLSGWGSKNEQDPFAKLVSVNLQETSLAYFPILECFNRLEAGKEYPEFIPNSADPTKFCTQPTKWSEYQYKDPDDPDEEPIYEGQLVGNSACLGDGGSALVALDSENKEIQIGIASGGPIVEPICGSVTIPNFHTKVSYYYDWIQEYVANESAPDSVILPPDFIENANQSIDIPGEEAPGEDVPGDSDTGEVVIPEECDESASVFKECGESSSGNLNSIWLGLLVVIALVRRFRHQLS
ncbi:hypothetical protein BCT61_08200 [Vibrio breoganii]|uniref:S1 family peptidase n=1 Tax=Vibrio breoganii TaxID=553239 RepID=UPI000CB9D5A9|nr:trypsin-like serine protease [Vibrio breoganii]PMM10712.1 hypothetical protein BCT61_08200 [Vibrio breoganii]